MMKLERRAALHANRSAFGVRLCPGGRFPRIGIRRTLRRWLNCTSATLQAMRWLAVLAISSVLSPFSPPQAGAAVFTWDGGAWPPNAYWDTAANWNQGSDKPNNDDDLLFAGAVPLVNTNNRPSSVAFKSATFSTPGYEVWGRVKLTDGLTLTHGTGATRFKETLELTKAQTIHLPDSQARLRLDTSLQLPANGTPEDVIVGNPPPVQVVTLDHVGRIDVAELNGRGGKFEKYGSGLLVIDRTGDEFMSGHIYEGSLQVTGPAEDPDGDGVGLGLQLVLHQGSTLYGWGTVRGIGTLDGGTVFPGGLGLPLTVQDSVNFAHADATLRVSIGGSGPNATSSQIKVGAGFGVGMVILQGPSGNCKLDVTFQLAREGFSPVLNQSFKIIDKLNTSPVSGTFAGLPEGAEFVVDGVHFRISYVGATGNDVVLTVVAVDPSGVQRVWDGGGADNNWTNRFNWVGDVRPGAGDDLVFPPIALQKTSFNNFPAGSVFNSISLTGSGYQLQGNRAVLNAGLHTSHASGNNIVAFLTELPIHQTFTNSAAGTLEISGNIKLNDWHLTFRNDGGNTTVSGIIYGAGSIFKKGPAQLTLSGANTYLGWTVVYEGKLRATHATALGSSGFKTTVLNSGSLWISGPFTVNEPLELSGDGDGLYGALVSETGANVITGNIKLNSDALVGVYGGSGSQLTLSGTVSGSGGLQKTGQKKLILTGAFDNTYAGSTTVREGTLELSKMGTQVAIPGALVIGDGNGFPNSAVVNVVSGNLNNHQIADNAAVLVNNDGKLLLSAPQEAIGSLAGSGSVELPGIPGPKLVAGYNNASTEFSGSVIGGDGVLQKMGSGTMTLSGACSHGQTWVSGGTVLINASHSGSVSVPSAGTLGGHGAIGGNVTLNGTFNPGPGGALTVQGNVQANANSHFLFDLNGPIAGVDYDQLSVAGTVSLNNNPQLTVNLAPNFTPDINYDFTIIDVAGSSSSKLMPGFWSLNDPSLNDLEPFSAGNLTFQIDYYAKDGNDVVIRRIASMQMAMVMAPDSGSSQIRGQFLPDQPLLLEAATELKEPIRWIVVNETRADRDGNFVLTDPEARQFNCRFYRVRTP